MTRLAVAVVMDGIEDYGGQHGQAVAIAIGMARRGHDVAYVSRWPVDSSSRHLAAMRAAGVDVLAPREVSSRRRSISPTADDVARLRRLLVSAWQQRAVPSRRLLRTGDTPTRAAADFARIAIENLRRWRRARGKVPFVMHVIARPTAQYLTALRSIEGPVVFSEFGGLALYRLSVESAPALEVDAVTTDSPDGAAELASVQQAAVAIIPCIAGSPRDIVRVPERAQRLVMANRLVDYKQTHVAVDAVAQVSLELDVYGGGPDESHLRERVSRLQVADRIRFHGQTGGDGVMAALDSGHAFISCSRLDGTPMSVIEAMSRGRAVVAAPLPGIESLVDEGVEGFYFDGTTAGLEAVLSRLATEVGLARDAGLAARRKWERDLAPDILLDRYEAVYRDVLAD